MTALVHTGLNCRPADVGPGRDTAWVVRAVLAAVIAVAIVALGGLRGPEQDPAGLRGEPPRR